MKKALSLLLCFVVLFCSFTINSSALDVEENGLVLEFNLTSGETNNLESTQARATGLILSYSLSIKKSGNTLMIAGSTNCNPDVVKCGFKNLVVERRANSSSSWQDFCDLGNVYIDSASANLSTSMNAPSGYQYRVTTKHYAKKSLLVTQTISNESNYLTF